MLNPPDVDPTEKGWPGVSITLLQVVLHTLNQHSHLCLSLQPGRIRHTQRNYYLYMYMLKLV